MYKVMTIVGTRPELIKLSMIIKELDNFSNHIMVHTGQNYDYELNGVFFKELNIRKPDYYLKAVGNSTAQTIGNIIAKADEIMEKEKPDAILIYGDTNSALSIIPAKRRKIPVFHMEAGNRCFDQRVPEELNRKILDHLADINMTISEHARTNLLKEGIKPNSIIKVGSSMKEVFNEHMYKINKSDILKKLGLTRKGYFLLSAHREENIDSDKNFNLLKTTLNKLAVNYKKRIIFSAHPRTLKRLKEVKLNELIEIMKPLGFFDYNKLQQNAFCVISDSGTITEESSILGFPAITIRETHERPEGTDEGTLIMSGLEYENVKTSIDIVTKQTQDLKIPKIVSDYDTNKVSLKVIRTIQSYIEYINRETWKKSS